MSQEAIHGAGRVRHDRDEVDATSRYGRQDDVDRVPELHLGQDPLRGEWKPLRDTAERTLVVISVSGAHARGIRRARLPPVVVLLCPVRACRLPLTSRGRHLACRRGHSFDIARRGYVNLLQVQDRRSRQPGDSVAATEARQRLLSRGIEAPLIDAMIGLLTLTPTDAILEVGCGEGYHLAAIAARFGCEGYGVDISAASIAAAAKRHPRLHWIVANADRLLPYADASFHAVVSVTARRNAVEFRRVLSEDGTLLVVVPAPDDLIELREAVLGEGRVRDRIEAATAALAPHFTLDRHKRLRHVACLDPAAIRAVMTGSYRALRASQRVRLASLGDLDVTLSRDALLFRPSRGRGRPVTPSSREDATGA